MTARPLAIPLALLLPLAAAGAAPTRETLPGGLELAVVEVPGARTASLRVVVRAGSALEPAGREGLAHVLEHLLLGVKGPDGLDVVQAAKAAGGDVNGFTSQDTTTFTLDAPAATFAPLAGRVLRALSTFEVSLADVDREQKVIDSEHEGRGDRPTVYWFMDRAIFPAREREANVIGGKDTREAIELADLRAFHGGHYRRDRIAVVFTGAVGLAEARGLVEAALSSPAGDPGAPPRPPVLAPSLPATARLRAPLLAALVAYRLDAADRFTCPALAALVEQRLVEETVVRRPLARSVWADCASLRGTPFVLALAHVPSIEADDLPKRMDRVFGELAAAAPAAAERRRIEQRMARAGDRLRARPEALADHLAQLAVVPGDLVLAPMPGGEAGFPSGEVLRAARRTFRPDRRVLVLFSPFEGD